MARGLRRLGLAITRLLSVAGAAFGIVTLNLLTLTPVHAETIVRVGTNLGDLFITLRPDTAPATVANFRNYVQSGAYNDSFFDFSQPAAPGVEGVIQTGRFFWPAGIGNGVDEIDAFAPVADEFSLSNARGTVAASRPNNEPNSATSSWFINTSDNGGSSPSGFDFVNGGVTVFGELNARSLALADEIAALRVEDRGDNFENLPLTGEPTPILQRSQTVLILDSAEFEEISDPVAAILPGSRTVPVGVRASAFATLLNTDANNEAASCRLTPPIGLEGSFSYQLTDPQTNTPFGAIDPLVDIVAGGSATFIFSIIPSASFESAELAIDFNCGNADLSAPSVVGVNTFTLAAPVGLSSDVVALSRTVDNTGINDIPLSIGSGAFAVAVINVGDGETITVTADDGDAELPVEFFICETDPDDGLCLAAPTATIEGLLNANTTATFAVFAQLTDANSPIEFSPAENRAFVRFRNSQGALRGSTSVALRTVSD